jgi:hypothetical protein
MSEKTPCTNCGTEILAVTAKYNAGLCGTCNRLKEQEAQERERLAKREAEKRQGLFYDIDAIVESADFTMKLCDALPESDEARYELLTEDEKMLQALGEFDLRSSNGLKWMLDNEHHDLLDRTRGAARNLPPTTLLEALNMLEDILRKYDVPDDPALQREFIAELDDEKADALNRELEESDEKYFHYRQGEPSLWADPDFREVARQWTREHLEDLRFRKAPGV